MTRLSLSPALAAALVDSGLEVVVTGATGWLGQATLELLDSCPGWSMASRVHAFASRARTVSLRSGTRVEVHPLRDLPRWKVPHCLVTHYAFATREHVSRMGLSEYVARNEAITSWVVDYVSRHRPAGLAVVSSGAVYAGGDLSTNPYGVLKARDEATFLELQAPTGDGAVRPRVVVPRLFNLAGPFLTKPDDLVLGSIIRDIAAGGPIRLRSTHPVVRSYVHVGDLVELLLATMLGDGPLPTAPFDTAGEREVEVGQLAELAASVLGHPGMAIDRPPLETTEADRYVGDPTTLRALAEAYGIGLRDLPAQIVDTADFMIG